MTDMEKEIRRVLRDVLDPINPRPSLPAQTVRRAKARRAISAGLTGVTVVMVLAAAWLGVSMFGAGTSRTPPQRPVGPPETGPEPTPVPNAQLVELAAVEDSVWAVTCDRKCANDGRDSEGSAHRLDPESGAVEASVSVPSPHDIAIGEGAIWVISFWDGTVHRIDPSMNSVAAAVELELPTEIAPGDSQFLPFDGTAGEGGVWVSSGRGEVARIDPDTNRVAAIISTPADTTGHLAAGEGGVWVAQNVLGLYRIDPATNQVVAKIPIQEGNRRLALEGVAVGGDAVWVAGTWAQESAPDERGHVEYVATEEEAVYRIDPETNTPTPVSVAADHGPIAFGEGALWVTSRADAQLSGIDPDSGEVSRTLALDQGERLLDVGGGAVWVADGDGGFRRIEVDGR
jgi:virginiamycin B lyase